MKIKWMSMESNRFAWYSSNEHEHQIHAHEIYLHVNFMAIKIKCIGMKLSYSKMHWHETKCVHMKSNKVCRRMKRKIKGIKSN